MKDEGWEPSGFEEEGRGSTEGETRGSGGAEPSGSGDDNKRRQLPKKPSTWEMVRDLKRTMEERMSDVSSKIDKLIKSVDSLADALMKIGEGRREEDRTVVLPRPNVRGLNVPAKSVKLDPKVIMYYMLSLIHI